MFKNKYLQFNIAAILVLLGGCAVVDRGWRGDLSATAPAVRESARSCAAHFDALDLAIARAGVGDAEAHRLPGFPYLRVDRFSASLRAAARTGKAAQAQWLARLQALDQVARRVEISNLPSEAVRELHPANAGRAVLLDATLHCANVLREHDASTPARLELIYARAEVPDAYVTWLRAAGLYSLTQWPFARGIAQWHEETQQAFQRSAHGRTPAPPVTRYVPTATSTVARAEIAALIRRASNNPLRVPQFSEAEQTLLLNAYAPVLEVESGGDYDRIGRLRLDADMIPAVDGATPVLYHRIAFTRFGNETLPQLVYTAWFPERPLAHALDVLGGRLDGVVVRVTLSADGEPLLYDSIHPCGCYHLFFPTARVQPLPAPEGAGEWAFVPASLPAHGAGSRIVLRIATRTHYISGVSIARDADGTHYGLLPESGLRTLPLVDDPRHTRSLYGPRGLVPGTGRGERYFFWPMGIPSAGAMRQWGHHATAFVGRRHFDDADLVEKRFRLVDH